MEEKKVYGVYKGSLNDVEAVKICTEQTLYFLINALSGYIWRMNHDMADGRIKENINLEEEQYALEFCVLQTTRFGVEVPEAKEGEHIKNTDSYTEWYRWWNSYFQRDLSQEEFDEYNRLFSEGKDISHFRPKGDWRPQEKLETETKTE